MWGEWDGMATTGVLVEEMDKNGQEQGTPEEVISVGITKVGLWWCFEHWGRSSRKVCLPHMGKREQRPKEACHSDGLHHKRTVPYWGFVHKPGLGYSLSS